MDLFGKRPLFTACIALALAALLAFYLPKTAMLWVLALGCLSFLIIFIIRLCRGSSIRLFTLLLILGFFLAGGTSALKREIERKNFLTQYAGESITAELTIKEVSYRYVYASKAKAVMKTQNGKSCRVSVLIYTENRFPFDAGDVISGTFSVHDPESSEEEWGDARTLLGEGYTAILTEEGDLSLIKSGTNSFSARLSDRRAAFKYTFSRFFEDDSAGLFSAMLLGYKKDLDTRTVRDFRQLGISHLLAVSGLHLMILTGILNRFLLFCRAGKKTRMVILALTSLAYCFLCGGAPPIVRASFMLWIYYLSDLAGGDRDTLTTLALVGALMVFFSPYILFQLSFEMTILATFGIAVIGEWRTTHPARHLPKNRLAKLAVRVCRALLASLVVTLAATMALLPVEWLVFGEISLMLPLSNLIFLPFATPLLAGGFLLLICSPFPALARLVAVPIGALSDGFLLLASKLARFDCMLSLRYAFVPFILIPLLALTAILLCLDLKKRRVLVLLPSILAAVAFSICLVISTHAGLNEVTVAFRSVGANEGLILTQNGKSVFIDFSNESYNQMRLNTRVAKEDNATRVATIVFTHYHKTLPNTLKRYLKTTFVDEILLPEPQNENEESLYLSVESVASREKVSLRTFSYNASEDLLHDVRFVLFAPLYEKRSTQPALALNLWFHQNSLRYECGAYREFLHDAGYGISGTPHDVFLLGTHGPRPHAEISVKSFEVRECAVVFSKQNTDYFADDMSFFSFSDGIWKEKFAK